MRLRLRGILRELDAARLAASACVHLRLDDDGAAQPPGDRFRLLRRGRDVAVGHRDAGGLQELAGLVLVQIHVSLTMVVPVSPRSAAGPSDSRAITARAPPPRTNPAAASTFGRMLPAGN